jgi:hypothetical protein
MLLDNDMLKFNFNIGITDKISQQPENCENRNDPDLVQASLKKWWVESVPHYEVKDFSRIMSSPLSNMFFPECINTLLENYSVICVYMTKDVVGN